MQAYGKNKNDKYILPWEIKKNVLEILKNFDKIKEIVDRNREISYNDCLKAIDYSRVISVSPTNIPCDSTFKQTLAIIEISSARLILNAIDDAIYFAAGKAPPELRGKYKKILYKSLIYKVPREKLNIHPRTLSKYRNIAIYKIAVNLDIYDENVEISTI